MGSWLRFQSRCILSIAAFFIVVPLTGDPVAVRHSEGLVRGFLVLRDLDGHLLASGDLSQTSTGDRVTNALVFHFKDGSIHEETTVFRQQHTFQLLTYHLVQKGPSFKRPVDELLSGTTGDITIRYADEGKEKTISDHLKVPPDLANGLVTTLLNNIDPHTPKTTVSMVVSTPKPRIVKLEISPAEEAAFSIAGSPRKSRRFVVHVDIGGVAGVIAPIVGKQPADTSLWIDEGTAPGFLRLEGPLYEGGPSWRIELASPEWPKAAAPQKR